MNYRQYRAIFQDFVLQPSTGTKSFVISDDDRTLATNRSGIYPQLQLDTPSFTPNILRGSTGKKVMSGDVAILMPVENDDHAKQDRILETTETEIESLIGWVDYKRKSGLGDIQSVQAFPIKRYETINLWGWGLSLSISADKSFCFDTSSEEPTEYLTPIFVVGETEINISFGVNAYQVSWETQKDIKRALQLLKDQINADTGTTGIICEIFLDSITILNPNNLAITAGAGHSVINKSGLTINA